ncbi:MAG: NTP transferase domain-containing protein [Wolbachia endosymbiont of Meromenopon meropis]|nr:NTP transferase domain-containing protein [Wolbachia endosymbiont of Meromenopon meropis]
MKSKADAFIILAAGHSKRMNSELSKALHKIGNFPILEHIIYNAKQLSPKNIAVVINFSLIKQLQYFQDIQLIIQKSALGTCDAVKIAMRSMTQLPDSSIVVIQYGDTPFIKPSTITKMIDSLKDKALICLGFKTKNKEYGKLLIKCGLLKGIIEVQKNENCNQEFLANAGIIVTYAKNLRDLLKKVEFNKLKQEFYLTDIVSIATKNNLNVDYITTNEEEAIGINNRNDLAKAEFYFQKNKRKFFINTGVTLLAPETIFFSLDTQIGMDSIIYPYVFFGPGVKIGSNVKIGPFVKCEYTTIGKNAILGNFVEAKTSDIGTDTKIKHLSYIGNTKIGSKSNIGAGTVVCNYDGKKKHKTNIGNNCFIGANSSLIAPLNIRDNAIIAAGSVIVKDVPKKSLAIARKKQIIRKIRSST